MRIELKPNVAAIICETFAHAMIDEGDRFNYHFESTVNGKLHESESYHGFLSVEHAERDARQIVKHYEIPQPAPIITAQSLPDNWHVHICFHGDGSLECINPACWTDARKWQTDQVECPVCENITGSFYYLGSYQPKVNEYIAAKAAAAAA